MFRKKLIATFIVAPLTFPWPVSAATDAELEQIRSQIKELKQSYELRIEALEKRLQQTENKAPVQASSSQTSRATAPRNIMNPEISLVLSSSAASLSQDPNTYKIDGFAPSGGDIGPGKRGLRLDESEFTLGANIDPHFYGALTFALTPENEAEVEEALVRTTSLPHGFTAKAGRFLSSLGYLNEQHSHNWDFLDAPLVYQAFLGGQFKQDGIQAKWVAPTDLFVELGAEAGNGNNFPSSDRNKNGVGANLLFARVGGDVGVNHSWRVGASHLRTSPKDRQYIDTDLAGTEVSNAFNGRSKNTIFDFIWKWAPNGNATQTNFKIQGEYFKRKENGDLTYDTEATSLGTTTGAYSSSQSGYYLQGIYQFIPRWRVGLRTERLKHGDVELGINSANLTDVNYSPTKNSLMFDYSPSEFSRFRLQFAKDKSRQDATDNQIFLQYIMNLGAHGPHKF